MNRDACLLDKAVNDFRGHLLLFTCCRAWKVRALMLVTCCWSPVAGALLLAICCRLVGGHPARIANASSPESQRKMMLNARDV